MKENQGAGLNNHSHDDNSDEIHKKTEKSNHGHQHIKPNQVQGNIKIAFFLNLAFTLIEIVGGIFTNSMAILSDALHDLGDSLSLGLSWFLEKYSQKKPDSKFSYGYARFSLLGALINSLILVGGSILILSRAIPRLFQPEAVNPEGMLVLAILGILVNGLAVLRLKKGTSLNEKVVSWHLLEDVFGWVAILITSIVLLFVEIPIIDPILSIALTIYVLFNVAKNLKSVLNVLLEGVPEDVQISEIEKKIADVHGIVSVHHTHIWTLDGEKIFLSTHIVISEDINSHNQISIKNEVKELLSNNGIEHTTIETDYENEYCKDDSRD